MRISDWSSDVCSSDLMSAIGTALGPSLGGVLISGLSWRAIFLVNVPLGILTFLLARRYLPDDRREPATDWAGFDNAGTLLLALTLAAYALAMTIGRGSFGPLNMALLSAADRKSTRLNSSH